jgi:hypothetical protein
MSVEAINLTFIKRFKFPEPVFSPDNLVGSLGGKFIGKLDCRFLSNQDQINQRINKMKKLEIKKGWVLKPIKNLNIPEDNFWRPFKYEAASIHLIGKQELPFYPFQVIVDDGIKIERGKLESVIQSKIIDYKVNIQARIYPPGVGTAHLYLYLKPTSLNLDSINSLFNPENILINYKHDYVDVNDYFFNFINSLVGKLVKEPSQFSRDVSGLYKVINFQGDSLPLNQNLNSLSKILSGLSSPSDSNVMIQRDKLTKNRLAGKGKNEDILIISNRAAMLYVDEYLKNKRSKILKGRRCFRNHFINAIELAYATDTLLDIYYDHFEKIRRQIDALRFDKSVTAKVNSLLTTNLLDPCIYLTLKYSLLNVHEKLEIPWTAHVFYQACKEFNINPKIEKTVEKIETLVQVAEKWNIQVDTAKKIYNEIKDWADKFIQVL